MTAPRHGGAGWPAHQEPRRTEARTRNQAPRGGRPADAPPAQAPLRPQPLDWARDAATWPHADKSHFVSAGGWRWHVQVHHGAATCASTGAGAFTADGPDTGAATGADARAAAGPAGAAPSPGPGEGPRSAVLLLHGTGASGHSWRLFAPLLAGAGHCVLVPDLPGHGFTRAEGPMRLTLPAMGAAAAALLRALRVDVRWVVGHSAGAAVAAQLALEGAIAPRALVAFNGALLPLQGPAGTLFSPVARWLALNPLVPSLFAWYASQPSVLRRLVDGTGSQLDEEGRALYGRLVRDPVHVAGALAMMASWDLRPLQHALPRLAVPLELFVGGGDRTLPPAHAERVRALVPAARITRLPRLGHLMHEEQPAAVWARLCQRLPALATAEEGAARRGA